MATKIDMDLATEAAEALLARITELAPRTTTPEMLERLAHAYQAVTTRTGPAHD